MLLARLREWLTWEAAAEHVMRRHELPNFLRRQSGTFVVNVSPGEQTDILRETFLLAEIGLVNETAIGIHLTSEHTFTAIRTEPRKCPMESSNAGEEVYELNFLHI